MSKNIVEELPARKHAPASPKPVKAGAGSKGSVEEGSEKKIRQAVYDIRYRARREDIDLKAAFAQYMANSSLNQKEKSIVRAKLFGKDGGGVKEQAMLGIDDIASDNLTNALYKVFVKPDIQEQELELPYLDQLNEEDSKKFKVRVTDNNGKTYVRYANRDKITQLRQNNNIKSVEMTGYGEPYEGSRKKKTSDSKPSKPKLDPVGKEDKDIDNDGDHDKTDKYLLKRRKAIGAAIRKKADKKIREAYLADGTITTEPKNKKKITGENVDNYATGVVKVAPVDKDEDPSVKSAKGGIYASFAHQRMLDLLSEKKKEEEEKKDKISDMMTKDSVKKDDEEKEEKPDTRGMYAKINLVKNKLRAAGQRDPMVMAVDACEERTPAKDDPSFSQEYKDNAKKAIKASKKKKKPSTRPSEPVKHLQGDKKPSRPSPMRKPAKKYNPYGEGSNMNPTKASETTGP